LAPHFATIFQVNKAKHNVWYFNVTLTFFKIDFHCDWDGTATTQLGKSGLRVDALNLFDRREPGPGHRHAGRRILVAVGFYTAQD
jgi:hypothetical protein